MAKQSKVEGFFFVIVVSLLKHNRFVSHARMGGCMGICMVCVFGCGRVVMTHMQVRQ